MGTLIRDFRYAVRTLTKAPTFTGVAVLTLALGIGANTAIFSVIEAVLLRSLPVPSPQQLFLVEHATGRGENIFSFAFYQHLRDALKDQAQVLALTKPATFYAPVPNAPPMSINGQLVSGNFFSALQVLPFRGRLLTSEDNLGPDGNAVVVISYGCWSRYFNGNPEVVGRTFTLNRVAMTVVGVTPPEFFGLDKGQVSDFWAPLALQFRLGYHRDASSAPDLGQADMSQPWTTQPGVAWLHLVTRITNHNNVSTAAAIANTTMQRDLSAFSSQIPLDERQVEREQHRLILAAGSRGLEGLAEKLSQPLLVLLAMTEVVLLIACANIAMLMMARGLAKRKEVAVRLAIGARRSALAQQFLTESTLIALLGCVLGLILARCLAWTLPRILGGWNMPTEVTLNQEVVVFAVLVSSVAALLVGLAPILVSRRMDLCAVLKYGRGTDRSGLRLRGVGLFVVSQVALSLLLMISAGLLARSLENLFNTDSGLVGQRVLTAQVYPRAAGYTAAQLPGLYKSLLTRIQALPGVQGASLAGCGFFCEEVGSAVIEPSGRFLEQTIDAHFDTVSSDYLTVRGIQVLRGQDFLVSGGPTSPLVAMVNQVFARRFLAGRDPIGQHISGPGGSCEIVGVVADAKINGLRADTPPFVIYPLAQAPGYVRSLEVRTIGDPMQIGSALRKAIADAAPDLPIGEMQTIQQRLDNSLSDEKLTAALSGFFAILALGLSCLGLHGVMAYSVTRRTSELGIRMALGAQRTSLFWKVLRESLQVVLIGLAVGLGGALVAARLLRGMLFGLSATDPVTIAAAMCAMTVTAMLASYIPARRAMRVDPMVALRCE